MQPLWQPSADISALRKRADIIQQIRQFFYQRNVLEVDTPALSHATVTDIHLQTFSTEFMGPHYHHGQTLYLMTSPEFHMKRLLAAGSGCIYQMAKAFRNEEHGKNHNPEFTMLEWYRVGFNHQQLMLEVDELLQLILGCLPAERMSYQQAFMHFLSLCPLETNVDTLREIACQHGLSDIAAEEENKDTLLQLLFSLLIEPKIGQDCPIFIYDFPASQAALAKINQSDPRIADRFEVYYKGVELANGFHELDDADEQLARFDADNQYRAAHQLPIQPIDHHLIAALKQGLPECAGVALGIDRLLMLALGVEEIQNVLAFSFPRS